MPYTSKQHKLFQAAAHDAGIARAHGLTKAQAKRLAHEGTKRKVHKNGH